MTAALTPEYAPFEEYAGDSKIGPWTDIYGLAASLYYAILKTPPQAPTLRVEDPTTPSLREQVPRGAFRASFLSAIDHGLAVHPATRPQTGEAWRTELFRRSRIAKVPRRQIFISYRRADSTSVSRQVYDRLARKFGPDHVFFDVDTIPTAVDFRAHIAEAMDMTAVCIAVIGSRWHRRMGWFSRWRDIDHVHVEIGLALQAGIPIIRSLWTMRQADTEPITEGARTVLLPQRCETEGEFNVGGSGSPCAVGVGTR